jgi:hypothetical protein
MRPCPLLVQYRRKMGIAEKPEESEFSCRSGGGRVGSTYADRAASGGLRVYRHRDLTGIPFAKAESRFTQALRPEYRRKPVYLVFAR